MSNFSSHQTNSTPPAKLLPVLQKLKEVYKEWCVYNQTLTKIHRYSLGQKIDVLFIEAIEAISVATFLDKTEKLPWINVSVRKIDTLKILLMILWETKSLDNKKYIALSIKIEELGKMLGGWSGHVKKQNYPQK